MRLNILHSYRRNKFISYYRCGRPEIRWTLLFDEKTRDHYYYFVCPGSDSDMCDRHYSRSLDVILLMIRTCWKRSRKSCTQRVHKHVKSVCATVHGNTIFVNIKTTAFEVDSNWISNILSLFFFLSSTFFAYVRTALVHIPGCRGALNTQSSKLAPPVYFAVNILFKE